MWHLAAITVHLTTDKGETDSLTWGYDGKKNHADFLQMILLEITAHLAGRNDTKPQTPAPDLPATPRAANRPARSLAEKPKGKRK